MAMLLSSIIGGVLGGAIGYQVGREIQKERDSEYLLEDTLIVKEHLAKSREEQAKEFSKDTSPWSNNF